MRRLRPSVHLVHLTTFTDKVHHRCHTVTPDWALSQRFELSSLSRPSTQLSLHPPAWDSFPADIYCILSSSECSLLALIMAEIASTDPVPKPISDLEAQNEGPSPTGTSFRFPSFSA